MTAQEMFEELGYKKENKIYDYEPASYIKHFGTGKYSATKKIFFVEYWGVFINEKFDVPLNGQQIKAYTITKLELDAINQQCKELGWLNE